MSYKNIQELIDEMSLYKQDCEAWFSSRKDINSIIIDSVGGNTFRAFNVVGNSHPSIVFREWAINLFESPNFIKSIIKRSNESNFDEFNLKICNSLKQYWDKYLEPLSIFKARKLINLLLKEIVLLHDLTDEERKKLISLLHIPIDKYTLQAIKSIFNNGEYSHNLGKIPPSASMGYIDDNNKYSVIQGFFKKLASKVGVPPIYFDVLIWNRSSIDDKSGVLEKQSSPNSSASKVKATQTNLPVCTYNEFLQGDVFSSYTSVVRGIVKKLLEEIAAHTKDFKVKQRKGAFAITPSDRTRSNAITVWIGKSQIKIEFFNEEKRPYHSQEEIIYELIERIKNKLASV